jgi:hypothetical protein
VLDDLPLRLAAVGPAEEVFKLSHKEGTGDGPADSESAAKL